MQLSLEGRPSHIVTFPDLYDNSFVAALHVVVKLLQLDVFVPDSVESVWNFFYRGLEAYAYARFGMLAIQLNDLEVAALRMAGFTVEPNSILKLAGAPCGTGVVSGRSWALDAMNIVAGTTATGAGIPVAILDSGLDLTHADFLDARLKSRVADLDQRCFLPGSTSIQDALGHGTHCAGSIFGVDRGGGYRYSVAPGIRPIIGKVIDDNRQTTDDILTAALEWAASRGAKVISMSLGQLRPSGRNPPVKWERMANKLFGEERFLVAASGNDGVTQPVESPAACQRIMAASALRTDLLRLRSNCNRALDTIGLVDICAPGTSICSTRAGGGYAILEGTSMATAHIAGLAALYWEKLGTTSVSAVWNAILSNADPIPAAEPGRTLADYGRGRARFV